MKDNLFFVAKPAVDHDNNVMFVAMSFSLFFVVVVVVSPSSSVYWYRM